ncbi:MAG: hypothetical protein ABIR68_05350, partial [Ilumatobacteraceae bacterium]
MALLVGGCSSSPRRVDFDPVESTTATTATSGGTATTVGVGQTASAPATTSVLPDSTPTSALPGAVESTGAWVNITGNLAGLASECGNMGGVSVRPDEDVVFASVARQGFFANTDGTDQWTPIGTGAGSTPISNRWSSTLYDPQHPGTWWSSGSYGSGVFKTTDGGSTFARLGDVVDSDYVGVDLTDPARSTLLSGRHESSKVDRSTDGGTTWSALPVLPPDAGFTSVPYVVNSTTYLLGTYNSAHAGIFRTTDAGATWTLAQPGNISSPPLLASDGRMYWVLNNSTVVVSSDQGATWTTQSSGFVSNGHLVEMAGGRLAGLAVQNITTSVDGGKSWTVVGPAMPITPNGMAYSVARKAFYAWYWD